MSWRTATATELYREMKMRKIDLSGGQTQGRFFSHICIESTSYQSEEGTAFPFIELHTIASALFRLKNVYNCDKRFLV
ncbi:unnamed protein product [Schistosoma mattheei]|uniref:Uncharacterized protein n=1 Tax=Schistosoma mattheei TaxID=31246 RepID=A0AA85C2K5_9TREM|nr:unnamed protein product [Schistosoma mattheei]